MVKYSVVTKKIGLLSNKVCLSRDSLSRDKNSKTVLRYLLRVSALLTFQKLMYKYNIYISK